MRPKIVRKTYLSVLMLIGLFAGSTMGSIYADCAVVFFGDPNLAAAVETELAKVGIYPPITETDMLALTSLDAGGRGLAEPNALVGLEYALNLKSLNLSGNYIFDLTPLAGLNKLRRLNLAENDIKNLYPLSGLTGLTFLDLQGNRITNISPLIGLVQLESLDLDRNDIEVIEAAAGLEQLERLSLRDNHIKYISAAAGLSGLKYLYLSNNKIKYIGPTSTLFNLKELDLVGNQIGDISALSGHTALSTLDLRNNSLNITDYCMYLRQIRCNNPGVALRYDRNPFVFWPGDGNGDCRVDLFDYFLLAALWLETDCGDCGGVDFNNNQKVDTGDLEILSANWLEEAIIPNQPPVVDAGPPQIGILLMDIPKNFKLSGSVIDESIPPGGELTWKWKKTEGPPLYKLIWPSGFEPNEYVLNPKVYMNISQCYTLMLTASDGVYEANDVALLQVQPLGWTGEINRYRFDSNLNDTGIDSEIDDHLAAKQYPGISEQSQKPEYYLVNPDYVPGIIGQAVHLKDVSLPDTIVPNLDQPQPNRTGTMLQCPASFETGLYHFGTWTIDTYIKPDPGTDTPQHLVYQAQVDGDEPNSNDNVWYVGIDPHPYRIGGVFYQHDGKEINLRYRPEAEIPEGEWSHVAFVGDGLNVTLWVNGVDVFTTAYDGTLKESLLSEDGFRISSVFADRSYRGLIDDIRINLTALDPYPYWDYMKDRVLRIPIELVEPADGFEYVDPDHCILKWKPGKGPYTYEYEVWLRDLSAGGPWVKLTATADTSYAIPGGILVNGNDYQWRIAPIVDGDPSAGTDSNVWEFKTIPSEI